MIRTVAALLVLIALQASATVAQRGGDVRPTLILVCFDGWRWDYAARFDVPNVHRLIDRGVRAESLIPSFPTKTFPNLYTIATGLYPGHHGIVANNIRDTATGRRFSMGNRTEVQDAMWWGGEPLWAGLERTGTPSAPMFWAGSEAPIGGRRPTYWMPFEDAMPGEQRVDRLLAWLDRPEGMRPAMLTLYLSDVDTAAHGSGPDSAAAGEAARRVDRHLGRLLAGLERRRLVDSTNIVVVSDHGLAETSINRVVVLDDYISLDDVDIVDLNPTVGLFPQRGREDAVYRALANAHPRLKVYRRADSPEHWHFREHPRVPPIVGVVDDGWQILRRSNIAERVARALVGPRGEHGFDPRDSMAMRGIFVAAGPSFKAGVTVPAFENVNVYNALAAALRVTPAKNDGDPAVARALMR